MVKSENQKFIVEDILNMKKKGKKEYFLIKWKDYNLSETTWEPKENLQNCQEILKRFFKKKKK